MASGVVSPTGIGACLLPSDAFGKIFCIEVVAGTFIASCIHENTKGERKKESWKPIWDVYTKKSQHDRIYHLIEK
jgi:hypothetical protein